MTITYITRDTDRAAGYDTATHEDALELDTATVGTETVTVPKSSSVIPAWMWSSPANEPNSDDWPSGDFHLQIDVNAVGADISWPDRTDIFARVRDDLGIVLEIGPSTTWDSNSGTGLKIATGTKDFSAGAAGDRFGVRVAMTNTAMKDQDVTLNLNTSSTFADGPWTGAAPEVVPFLIAARRV